MYIVSGVVLKVWDPCTTTAYGPDNLEWIPEFYFVRVYKQQLHTCAMYTANRPISPALLFSASLVVQEVCKSQVLARDRYGSPSAHTPEEPARIHIH